jgi:hypothetical protein
LNGDPRDRAIICALAVAVPASHIPGSSAR